MTAPKDQAPAAEPEQPAEGGSYLRQPGGKLKRVAFTEEAAPPASDQQAEG